MEREFIWIEIVEPKSNKKMYANMETGETTWRPPPDMNYKQSNDNQWWELFDKKTNKHYYFNATLNKTVWKRPMGADIVPLTKLQAEQETRFSNRSPLSVRSADVESPVVRSHLRKAPSAPFRPNTDLPLQHNGNMTREQIASLYDCLDNGVAAEENTRNKRSQSEAIEPAWTNQQSNPLYVNLEHTSIPVQPSTEEVRMRNTQADTSQAPKQKYEHMRDSFDEVEDIPPLSDLDRYSRTLDPKKMGTPRDLYGDTQESGSAHCLTTQDTHSDTYIPDATKKPLGVTKSSSITFPPTEFPKYEDQKRVSSASLNPSGLAGILVRPRQYGETCMRLETFKELNQHKRGFIIQKKVSIADMLSWTKVSERIGKQTGKQTGEQTGKQTGKQTNR
eukprot:TRINITY_DN1069_c0_g4_i1.p1 TRINITY_DN1069_c0_g4~~TRINITY_DN1069_c0_g4_i1.p1  ORF type:complete len:391 (+),score=101.85 TRINITY_DN1069_c0_g4_i1:70-1242(+)